MVGRPSQAPHHPRRLIGGAASGPRRKARRDDAALWHRPRFPGTLPTHQAAESFLREFGGIAVNIGGAGIAVARIPFDLDPCLANGEDDRFEEWSNDIGRSLFPSANWLTATASSA